MEPRSFASVTHLHISQVSHRALAEESAGSGAMEVDKAGSEGSNAPEGAVMDVDDHDVPLYVTESARAHGYYSVGRYSRSIFVILAVQVWLHYM